jgi:hypothetical protein
MSLELPGEINMKRLNIESLHSIESSGLLECVLDLDDHIIYYNRMWLDQGSRD